MPQKPLEISTPLFYPRAEEQQHHFRVSSRVMPMPPGYTKVFGFAPRWCTTKIPRKKLRGIFYCCFPEKQELGAPSGARRARVFQAVKKTLVGASIARPCPFVCEKRPGKRVTVPSWRATNGRPYTFNRPRM